MWQYFPNITFGMLALWLISTYFYTYEKRFRIGGGTAFAGYADIGSFITILWIKLERPPLRTLAETRIWYSFFMGVSGGYPLLYVSSKWMLSYSALMGSVFILVTFSGRQFQYDTDACPPPVYGLCHHLGGLYFCLCHVGMATVVALKGVYNYKKNQNTDNAVLIADRLVNVGYTFLTFGLLFGALWAKETLGSLLDMGSKRNLGIYQLVGISHFIFTTVINTKTQQQSPRLQLSLLLLYWY